MIHWALWYWAAANPTPFLRRCETTLMARLRVRFIEDDLEHILQQIM